MKKAQGLRYFYVYFCTETLEDALICHIYIKGRIWQKEKYIRKEREINLEDGDITLWGIEEDCEDGSVRVGLISKECESAEDFVHEYNRMRHACKLENWRLKFVADAKTLLKKDNQCILETIAADFAM